MADLKNKPDPFRRGQHQLSADALNAVVRAVLRQIHGGKNTNVGYFNDRVLVDSNQIEPQLPDASNYFMQFVVLQEFNDYLLCTPFIQPSNLNPVLGPVGWIPQTFNPNLGKDSKVQLHVAKPYDLQGTPWGRVTTPTYTIGDIVVAARLTSGLTDPQGNQLAWMVLSGGTGDNPGMVWVRILCPNAGAYGYPGLVQVYDSSTFPGVYSDADGSNTSIQASIASGVQTVTPDSMTGIAVGSVFLLVDGLCGSQTVTVTAVSSTTFTTDLGGDAIAYPLKGVTITSPGSGYSGSGIPPTVSFTGGSGTGATGTAVLDASTGDTVASVTITNPGKDYTSTPTVVFDDSGTSGTGAAGTAVVSGPIKLYLSAVWVPFNPAEFTPKQSDVDEPVIYLARQEEDAPDGIAVFLALGGITTNFTCTDGSSGVIYAGRIVSITPAPA